MEGELTGQVAVIPPDRPEWEEADEPIPGAAGGGAGVRACVRGRASGMRMCDSASGSARRAGERTYIIVLIVFINNN